ncbi:hypothetical protein [Gracilinema caldarium]|uniref:Uncharacterized protein n=1 Tax=Gracilinema caldarium (strain ATCC 51460 / DSM 7334 / H1) TaxID=744872 RepID=F8EZY4_GRAC1|nr:hypothetical protein [Gracilinema caldarium]AEJ18497.1 hypothetical protein Spica_0332 [Gracilinema caldarium DSM 7334]
MNCSDAQNKLTECIDLREGLFLRSPRLAAHLILCKSCRKEAQWLKQGLSLLETTVRHRNITVPANIKENIMEQIAHEAPLQNPGAQNPISFRDWIVVGIILFIALCTLPFSSESPFMLIITVSIFLTLYGSLLIGTHLEELAHHFGLRQ